MEIYVNSSFSVNNYLTGHEEIHILVLVYLKVRLQARAYLEKRFRLYGSQGLTEAP